MIDLLEHIQTYRLTVDFGLVVLIWMVQLIVYPGFLFFTEKNLLKWHKVYTPKITIVVAPLMFLQAGIALYLCVFEYSILHLLYALLVASTWVSTFLYFVPLHQQIEQHKEVVVAAQKLSSRNLFRALQWTLVFIYGIIFLSS